MQFPLHRRDLILGTTAAAGLALAGCATTPRGAAPCTPLPRVRIDPQRVIRTSVGLRPYRRSGFVVRRDAIGDKAFVHNYGHGGAGVTLSWGSSRLATMLGLQGHSGAVAIIGAGVMGLTTARLVQEAGFPVTIYARDLPPQTTSNASGGQISPFGHYSENFVTPEWLGQFKAAMDYSWRRFQLLVGERYGVRWLTTYEQGHDEPGPMDPYRPNQRLAGGEAHPFPMGNVTIYDTMYVEIGRYLDQLLTEFRQRGGTIRQQGFADVQSIAALPESLIFNCTGIGARQLFGDEELQPVRGQVVVLEPQPDINYAASGGWGYMFPHKGGILLGGTWDRDVWDTAPSASDQARIVASHQSFFEGLRCAA
jgi:glycine/D-amino acid oxidase-like deaminating enzyme